MTDESDNRVLQLSRTLGGALMLSDAELRAEVPGCTALEIYCALTVVSDALTARLGALEEAARAERMEELGGVH